MRIFFLLAALLPSIALATSPGEQLMLAGKPDDALPIVQAEARAAPDDLDAQERYIDLLLSMQLGTIAETNFRRRVAANPDSADAHYLLGRVVPTAPLAAAEYQAALAIDPEHARSYMGLAAVYRATNQVGDAVDAYREALQRDPSLGEAWAGFIVSLLGQGRTDEALEAARLYVINVPEDAEGYLTIAELSPSEAPTVLAEAVQAAPLDPRTHAALAEAHLLEGDGDAAMASAVQALKLAPGHTGARLSAMFAHDLQQGRLDAEGYKAMVRAVALSQSEPGKARESFDLLVASYPNSPLVFMGRSRLPRDGDEAIADVRRALAIDPEMSEAQAALGLMLLSRSDFEGALMALDRAIVARPFDITLVIAAAKAAGNLDPNAGLARLEQAYGFFPTDVRLALVYAQHLTAAGGHERAMEVLAKTASQVPDGKLAVALAAIAKESDRVNEGAAMLDSLAESTGNSAFSQTAKALRDGGGRP